MQVEVEGVYFGVKGGSRWRLRGCSLRIRRSK